MNLYLSWDASLRLRRTKYSAASRKPTIVQSPDNAVAVTVIFVSGPFPSLKFPEGPNILVRYFCPQAIRSIKRKGVFTGGAPGLAMTSQGLSGGRGGGGSITGDHR